MQPDMAEQMSETYPKGPEEVEKIDAVLDARLDDCAEQIYKYYEECVRIDKSK